MRVLLVDDDAPRRRALGRQLQQHGFEIADEADGGDDALVAAVSDQPDLCLIRAGSQDGTVPTVRRLRDALPASTIVVLTARLVAQDLLAVLRAGADGYLDDQLSPTRLARTLHAATDGEPAISRRAVSLLIEQYRHPSHHQVTVPGRGNVMLTPREWEILRLLRAGLTTAQIAAGLHIAEVTVRTHISSILRRLDVPDRTSAIRLIGDI